MTLTIELTPDAERVLRRAAARRGMGATDLARELLEEQLETEDQEGQAPATGAELVAYWQAEGVFGAWAERTDIPDSPTYARELRAVADAPTPDAAPLSEGEEQGFAEAEEYVASRTRGTPREESVGRPHPPAGSASALPSRPSSRRRR